MAIFTPNELSPKLKTNFYKIEINKKPSQILL